MAADEAQSDDGATASTKSTTSSSVTDRLIGANDDPLIPSSADIARVFHEGRATWMHFARLAASLHPKAFPAGFGDPSIMLKDVPALPENLPRRGCLIGRPLWHVPDPEPEGSARNTDLNLQYPYGIRKSFLLSFPKPMECRVSARPPPSGHPPWPGQGALALLTMCWSYILSARLLELQGRKLVYSAHSLLPLTAQQFQPKSCDVVLDPSAVPSRSLVRWLCAILSPKPGWSAADGGGFPPWAAFCSGDASFAVISADGPASFSPNDLPPDSTQAAELLIELCALYGLLGPDQDRKDQVSEVSPPTAAFFAALALPFYRDNDLQPRFSLPSLGMPSIHRATLGPASIRIRQYVADLRYYMTLSMHPRSVGSIIWSIFWQPDVQCNLVSPWLSSILSVIKPSLDSCNLNRLAKIFAFRRPRVASWWLGIFLLGDATVVGWISRYLETLEERWGFGSMAPPDTAVAAWTGSPQSFLNEEPADSYTSPEDLVPRSDLLRHRYNFRLQDESTSNLSWRPFGHIAKKLIEPDLWPWLENGHARQYVHWIWWIKGGKLLRRDVQLGFRRDTGRFAADVPDRLGKLPAKRLFTYDDADIKLEPSKASTLRMIDHCMEEVSGDRGMEILALPDAVAHPWLKDWRGLE
ncbi:hypothetical protein L209DRAFT_754112 [Thermothelomyces heterothallicus CBS 203.75]